MSIQHYSGPLGKFDYDGREFEIVRYASYYSVLAEKGIFEGLHYVGYEVDGSKIHIPDGIKDCNSMFYGCNLETPPIIPNGVISCVDMFSRCESLKTAPVIPDSVIDCYGMFEGCLFLKMAPVIPNSVKECSRMFTDCNSLQTVSSIPGSVEDCTCMFQYCSSLEAPPSISYGVKKCYGMFRGCTSLKTSPSIPMDVRDCRYMFQSCLLLDRIPVIPDSVICCEGMFDSCSDKIRQWGKWNIEHRDKDMIGANCAHIVMQSRAMYKRRKQIAAERAAEGKSTGEVAVISEDEPAVQGVMVQAETEVNGNDAMMESSSCGDREFAL